MLRGKVSEKLLKPAGQTLCAILGQDTAHEQRLT